MHPDDMKSTSEIAKNISEALKNFYVVIDGFIQPRGLNLAILEGHKKNIESYVEREDIDEYAKLAFLSSYKRMVKEHQNCQKTVDFASSYITEDAQPQSVEEDWYAFFFDKVRLISDESVQHMWGKILANEVNTPGRFQRSLLHTLLMMSSSQAELFCNMTKFCLYEYNGDSIHPILFISTNVDTYLDSKIDSVQLLELENLGLIQCDFKNEYIFHKKKKLRYGNKLIEIYGDPNNDDKILAGNVRFTNNGRTLFDIVSDDFKRYRAHILDFDITRFKNRNCTIIINGRHV